MIVERTENPQWLSNAYLVADEESGKGVLIDGNDVLDPLLERAERDGIEITHILITHPHADHIAGLAAARERLGGPPLVAHPDAAAEIEDEVAESIEDGGRLSSGGLEIEAISTPGHAAGHLAFLIDGGDVFTADVLFKGTVGGTMAPGASGLDDLRASVMRLMELPPTPPSIPVTASRRRSAPSSRRTRSSASGVGSTSSARSNARSGDAPRRCCSGPRTTTAATRPGSGSPTPARRRSSAARKSNAAEPFSYREISNLFSTLVHGRICDGNSGDFCGDSLTQWQRPTSRASSSTGTRSSGSSSCRPCSRLRHAAARDARRDQA